MRTSVAAIISVERRTRMPVHITAQMHIQTRAASARRKETNSGKRNRKNRVITIIMVDS